MANPKRKKPARRFNWKEYLIPLVIVTVISVVALASSLLLKGSKTTATRAAGNTLCKKNLRTCLLDCMKQFPLSVAQQEECAIPCRNAFMECENGQAGERNLRPSNESLSCPEKCATGHAQCMATCRMCDGEPKNMCGCRGKTDRKKCEKDCSAEKKKCTSACGIPQASPSATLTPRP